MSMLGEWEFELELARVEAQRLTQVREGCAAIADACDAAVREVREVAVQQMAAADLRGLVAEVRRLREQIRVSPDRTRAALLRTSEAIQGVIARAEAEARRWTEEQTRAVAEARHVQRVAEATARPGGEAVARGREAVALAERGELAAAAAQGTAARRSADAEGAADLDERIRREVVRGILRTLRGMGFVVASPRLAANVVTMEGRLASGRRARFEVSLDGRVAFDLEGYEGRACADDLEKVETALRDEFGVRLGPPQVVWKNPDRISKGAQDLPTGERRKG